VLGPKTMNRVAKAVQDEKVRRLRKSRTKKRKSNNVRGTEYCEPSFKKRGKVAVPDQVKKKFRGVYKKRGVWLRERELESLKKRGPGPASKGPPSFVSRERVMGVSEQG